MVIQLEEMRAQEGATPSLQTSAPLHHLPHPISSSVSVFLSCELHQDSGHVLLSLHPGW